MTMKQYPDFSVRRLLHTDYVTVPTKQVLLDRFEHLNENYAPVFFDSRTFAVLQSIADRLLPQNTNDAEYIEIASVIDERLSMHKNDGWRYALLPEDGQCYKTALMLINKMAFAGFEHSFVDLSSAQQDEILDAVQTGNTKGVEWPFSPQLFFEEILTDLTTCFYSHPLAQQMIGYAGMADAHGWKHVGLNEFEYPEPKENPE